MAVPTTVPPPQPKPTATNPEEPGPEKKEPSTSSVVTTSSMSNNSPSSSASSIPKEAEASADSSSTSPVLENKSAPIQPAATQVTLTAPAPNSAATATTDSAATTAPAPSPAAPTAQATAAPPLKSTTMSHLKTKYLGELEYMLREFRKLERQLLGAKGAAQIEESAGSRERREKLHSFILHLEDTIRQIEMGCELEAEGKSIVDVPCANQAQDGSVSSAEAKKQMAESSALMNLTKEKEEEENVQKLEEHILANLLPVKVRLKKQLAAQQGATRNPAGMPATRRGSLVASNRGKGTFAAAAEQRRKQAEAARLAAQQQQGQY